ncbi:P-loop containing nucleoside triphosphate hydrolase protein [Boletus coccyginus]|nr:P-loop containing nucleoside triphosphate hydrolase protein [Boletus coccyginus]
MGATGSGKSTFINLASGSTLAVSDSLESCTIDVETSAFFLDERTVTLIDTPGFDDTTRSDTDILKSITDYLSSSYSKGAKLAGLIYMHRISDNKMGGPSRRNFHIFRNLCGDAGLQNVLLVTNMWSKVDHEEGQARERELASKEKFFKPALERGARMLRHDGSQASAHAILRHLVGREPSTLLVQDEMVNQEKDLAHTTAGADIMRELKEQAERHAEALEDLCLGIDAARLADDEETREILQEEARKAREKIERIRGDLERMVANFATENLRLENANRQFKKDFRKQKADADQKTQLFEEERRARELAEAGRKRAEAQLAAERESREREKREGERQEREQQERERLENDKKAREKREHERQEHERQEQERRENERKRKEHERQERERREREREELHKRMERERLEKEKARCLIQ